MLEAQHTRPQKTKFRRILDFVYLKTKPTTLQRFWRPKT